ncbi:MAG: S8 family serine peptidase [Chloroflexota bacterium]|nr:S8 family serine peptidase [Chloroflexota bacterium]
MLSILLSVGLPGSALATPARLSLPASNDSPEVVYAAGEVLVTWHEATQLRDLEPLFHQANWTVEHTIEPIRTAVLLVPPGQESNAIKILQADARIDAAELNYQATAAPAQPPTPAGDPATRKVQPGVEEMPAQEPRMRISDASGISTPGIQPNDTYWLEQWGHRRAFAPQAWEITTGESYIVVSVVDSGIDLDHPEFGGRLLSGYDFVDDDSEPQDTFGHGTHVSGIIAATGNNDVGIAGMAWNIRIRPFRVLDSVGVGYADDVADAIVSAANHGDPVINLSLTFDNDSTAVRTAVTFAASKGTVLVGSTGNTSQPGQPPAPVKTPASYPEVVAVSATTHWDNWAPYANGGPEVELAAPGGTHDDPIFSTGLGGGYALQYGTSFSAPHVSGLFALMRSLRADLSPNSLLGILRNTADKVDTYPYLNGRNDRLGYGRINAAKALRQVLPPQLTFSPASPELLAAPGQLPPPVDITIHNPSNQPLSWQVIETTPAWLTADEPTHGTLSHPASAILRLRLLYVPGLGLNLGQVRVRVTEIGGQQTTYVLTVRVRVVETLFHSFLPSLEVGNQTTGWIDTSAGIPLSLSSDGAVLVSLPFGYPYFGLEYDHVWIHANGFLSFGDSYAGSQYSQNHCVPAIETPNGAIYALWDDLDPSQDGQVLYRQVNDRTVVVEWHDVPPQAGAGFNTFQVILSPDGKAVINYGAIDNILSSTVGLENWDATMGWQTACNGLGDLPAEGRSVTFRTALN